METPLGYRIDKINAFRYLDGYIQDGYRKLWNSNQHISYLRNRLESLLPEYILPEIYDFRINRVKNYRRNLKLRLQEKYNSLSSKNHTRTVTETKLIINLSSYSLSNSETALLNKGLNFSLPNTKKNIPKFVACIENAIENCKNLRDEDKTIIRHGVCGSLKSVKQFSSKLNFQDKEALKTLKSKENLVIAPADKNSSVVVIDKTDYFDKVNAHLSDTDTYESQNLDYSCEIRTTINQYLKKLFDQKLLTKPLYLHLFSNSATLPRFYALIKTHKPGYPIRPIVSFINSPSYNIAKFISDLLTPSTDASDHKLKNSIAIKEKLKSFCVPMGYVLVSYDVKALFTSIPINYALECVDEFLEINKDIYERTRLNRNEIYHLVKLCLNASLFRFNDKIFPTNQKYPNGLSCFCCYC